MSIFKMIRRRPTGVMAFTAAAVDNCDHHHYDDNDNCDQHCDDYDDDMTFEKAPD